jgi:RNA polymerase sigma-B factor
VAGREDPARNRIVEEHLGLVRAIARRYARGDEPLEDLVQVGVIGLLKAVDRFDARRGSDLRAIAAPFIEGEIRHHLRDRGGVVRGAPERVLPLADGDGPAAAPDLSDERALVTAGLDLLDGRDRRIIELRYFEDRRQADIAAELGISQTQVSRLIQRALTRMREGLGAGGAPPAPDRPTNGRRESGGRSGRVLVRMEPALHGRLAETAEARQQSLNGLITTTLESVLDDDAAHDAPPPAPSRRPTALLVANLVAILAAIAVGVTLLVLAVERGW